MTQRLVFTATCCAALLLAPVSGVAQQKAGDETVASEALLIQQLVSNGVPRTAEPPAVETPAAAAAADTAVTDLLKSEPPPDKPKDPVPETPPPAAVPSDQPATVAAGAVETKSADAATAQKINIEDLLKTEPPPAVAPPDQAEVKPVAPPDTAAKAATDVPPAVAPPPVEVKPVAPPDTAVKAATDVPPAVAPPPVAEAVAVPPIQVEPAVVPPAAVADVRPPSVVTIEDMEKVTREALRKHAVDQVLQAEKELAAGKFQEANRFLDEAQRALDRVGDFEGAEALRKRIYTDFGESYYHWGRLLVRQRNFERAEQMARNAGSYWHPKTAELLAEIEKAKRTKPPEVKVYPPVRWNQKEFREGEEKRADRLALGRQYYQTGEYERARNAFELVLRDDPENTEAIRMMHKIAQKKQDASSQELEMTRKAMVADVRKAWNRRDYGVMDELEGSMPTNVIGAIRPPPEEKLRQQIVAKMDRIIVPEVEFRQANINDVVGFLQDQSRKEDKEEKDETKKGVNIILNIQGPGGAAPAARPPADATSADPFAAPPAEAAKPAVGEGQLITFSARHISLHEALRIVCNVANLKYRIEGTVVMVLPFDAPEGRIIQRMYDVLPTVPERIQQMAPALTTFGAPGAVGGGGGGGGAPGAAAGQPTDLKEFFGAMGVPWPQGSSVRYVPQISKLFVANTSENLATFERILAVLNVVPSQIEIESRFVEVRQTDLDSLGFEWLLTDNWEIAQKKGSGAGLGPDHAQRVFIQASEANGGLTRGNRFTRSGFGLGGGLGVNDDVMRVASVLTNPELTFVLHALQQKGNADLLSAPKVTTKSGSEATIKVVREFIYPTEFTVTPITGTGAGGVNTIVGGVVEPGGFQTREVGVILSVLPEVSSDGQMIDLTMTPQVVDEPDWENYGSEYIAPDGSTQRLPMRQPIFKARTVSTSLSIYNGSTVVLGGMINEVRSTVDDKIPLLGDIPIIGRLFRSQYEHSDKRNLLIFVTARLVDPSGKPVTPQQRLLEALPGLVSSAAATGSGGSSSAAEAVGP
jgi:general secretion pathway protein D